MSSISESRGNHHAQPLISDKAPAKPAKSHAEIFADKHIEKKEWKGWQVFVIAITFPLSIPIYLIAQKINRCITDYILLPSRQLDKEEVRSKRANFHEGKLIELSESVPNNLVDKEEEILTDKSKDMEALKELYKDRPGFLDSVCKDYKLLLTQNLRSFVSNQKKSLLKTLHLMSTDSIKAEHQKINNTIRKGETLLEKIQKAPPDQIIDLMNKDEVAKSIDFKQKDALWFVIQRQLQLTCDSEAPKKRDRLYQEIPITTADGLSSMDMRSRMKSKRIGLPPNKSG